MFKEVEKFNSEPIHHVKEVHVVIFKQEIINDFMDAIKECVDNRNSDNKGYFGKFFQWFSGGHVTGIFFTSNFEVISISHRFFF